MTHPIPAALHGESINSQQIAELVQARHDSVKRTIERLADQEVIEFPPMVEIKTATKPQQVFLFTGEQGKLDSITVVAQLCPQFTSRIVKRWQELEKQVLAQKEIGRLLGVSRQTVSARLKRLATLGFSNEPQLALPGIATREV